MSHVTPSAFQPDEWVEEKVLSARQRTREYRAELERSIARRPLEAVAAGFAAGYLARSVPLARTTSAVLRVALAFTPHVLLAIGAARAWHFLSENKAASLPVPGKNYSAGTPLPPEKVAGRF